MTYYQLMIPSTFCKISGAAANVFGKAAPTATLVFKTNVNRREGFRFKAPRRCGAALPWSVSQSDRLPFVFSPSRVPHSTKAKRNEFFGVFVGIFLTAPTLNRTLQSIFYKNLTPRSTPRAHSMELLVHVSSQHRL